MSIEQKIETLVANYINGLIREELLLRNFNEKSLQHNLGQKIQEELGDDYIVQYERNIKYFKGVVVKEHIKWEMDICVVKNEKPEQVRNGVPRYVIEIKYLKAYDESLNKYQVTTPDDLYGCLKDIMFINELQQDDIKGMSIIFTNHPGYYAPYLSRKEKYKSLWQLFKNGGQLNQLIINEINTEKSSHLKYEPNNKKYSFTWQPLNDNKKYKDEEGHELVLKHIINKNY